MQTPSLKGIVEEIWNLFKIFISLILHTTNVSYTCFHLVWHSGTKHYKTYFVVELYYILSMSVFKKTFMTTTVIILRNTFQKAKSHNFSFASFILVDDLSVLLYICCKFDKILHAGE